MKKRLLTILLAASMVLMIPVAAFAEEEGAQATETPAVEAIETAEDAAGDIVAVEPEDFEAVEAVETTEVTQEAKQAAAEETPAETPAAETPEVTAEQPAVETGWNADRTQYRDENGNLVTGLFKAKMSDGVGALFYADDSGNVVKKQGLITVAYPKTRFLRTTDSEGHVGFRDVGSVDKNTYTYLIGGEEGAIVETAKIYTTSKGKVIVQDNGTVKTTAGFVTDENGIRRYVTTKGYVKTKAGWVRYNGRKYRVNGEGVVRTKVGAFTINGIRYVIPSSSKYGALQTKRGVTKAKDWLYFVRNDKGQLGKNLAYTVGSKVYHVTKKGVVITGKHKWKDGKYYFSTKSGHLRTKAGLITRDGKRFLVRKGGLVVVNQKSKYKGNYYISDKYGNIYTDMFTWKGTLYYASDKGVLKNSPGIITYKGNDYFVQSGGVVAINKMFRYNGKLYASDANGHLLSGLFKKGSTYYYADTNHVVNTDQEIITYKGSYYYNKRGGGLARNEWVNVGDKHYYAGDSAAFKTSTFTISGVTFNPSSTGAISDEEYKKLFPDPAEDEAEDTVEDVD